MPMRPETVRALLAQGDDEAPALLDVSGAALTYGDLREAVEHLRAELARCGVGRGDTIALLLPNGPELVVAFLAAVTAGAVAPLNPAYRAEELRFYLGDLRPRALITRGDLGAEARGAAPEGIALLELGGDARSPSLAGPTGVAADRGEPAADDVALLLHTSGTTARPKLVPLTQRNLAASASNIASWLQLGPADRCLNVMPLFHIHGLMAAVLASLAGGASVVATPGFDGFKFFEWLGRLEPTWYSAVPTMHQLILERAPRHEDVLAAQRLHFIRSSSAGLPPSVFAALEQRFGAPVIESYGMTEATHQMTSNPLPGRVPGLERRAGTVGAPAGAEIRILDPGGRPLAAGERGEVAIRGAGVTLGYVENPEANAAAFSDGWFRTGDEGYLGEDGALTLTGRLKELINRGGEKVAPLEVDDALLQHPAVAQAVAFAVPHPKLGEEVGAAVVLAEGQVVEASELRAFAAERLAAFKVPRSIVIVDEIPKGPTGKLQRIGLAERLGLA
jgi:acyl-CoA synthetase (AMP-forming)/AMP-acid ligase II